MIVKTFKPQFHNLVESGKKRQTIRPLPKRWPRVGETISCRAWIGAPYRSKQRILFVGTLKIVEPVRITVDAIYAQHKLNEEQIAIADGFRNFSEMLSWFWAVHHAMPFDGVLLRW
jgi:hypothetical protein